MEHYFSIQNIAFQALGYDMSYLEVWGTFFGLIAVVFAARENILSWPIGIANVILLFFLFYQNNLYADMFLQIFFLVSNICGWYLWLNPSEGNENQNNQLKITYFDVNFRIKICIYIVLGTIALGYFMSNLNVLLPQFFPVPASYAYSDTFVMTASIVAQLAMTRKKIESWLIWILVDVVAAIIYLKKGMLLMSIEYTVFCAIAALGFMRWYGILKHQKHVKS